MVSGTAFASPAPADNLFSPSSSIVTDITDDYGWETPVNGAAISLRENDNILEAPQYEDKGELERTEEISEQDPVLDHHFQSIALGRTKSITSWRLRTIISSTETKNIDVDLSDKRNGVPDIPIDSNSVILDRRETLEGITALARAITPKDLLPTNLYSLEGGKYNNLRFLAEKTWILNERAVSDADSGMKPFSKPVISCAKNQELNQSPIPPSQDIPNITISPPQDTQTGSSSKLGDKSTLCSKSISLADDTIQNVLSLLSIQALSESVKDKNASQLSLSKIIPIEIRGRLKEDNQHCPAWTNKGERCKQPHKTNFSHVRQCLDNMIIIKTSQLLEYLNDLISVTLCSQTHQRVARKEIENWMADIENLDRVHEGIQGTVSSNHRLLALADWISALSGTQSLSQTENLVPSSRPAELKENNSSDVPQRQRLLQIFEPYLPKRLACLAVSEALEKLLLKPLTKKTEIEKVGIVYVYWQPGNFGHLKIGYTDDLEKRMKGWNRQCNKTMEIYYPSRNDAEELIPVSHVFRVEKLVHTELKNLRRIEKDCSGCGKNHIEWFEAPLDLAVAVVRKWMAWMRESPYEERSSSGGGNAEWVLKEEQKSKLSALSQPLKEVSITAQPMEKERHSYTRRVKRLSYRK
ncbi:conserved hypothetical protein [Talaromyces stipitatus ATCC 10500]|uniref:Bacteriophage T5 Orf172 DNA-binding domain-containing protein n=1 Tax=Talaromyces stipitatus (strain ATCC 10500 / CBS 375.48 / QM 6759 / NRRL 1006) TaxID=441959 RepID=B8MBU9_TALSN|nr:uncharacterized protein TSTA_119880 [Talaromyces stipitatus ATCC 10500]EED18232.1 conserved hypothetical protein [Talaromyces stipitatus ATCC 10500]